MSGSFLPTSFMPSLKSPPFLACDTRTDALGIGLHSHGGPYTVAPAPKDSVQDRHAEAKLRLAIKHTKRTISASPGAATYSVESLKDGFDFTGSINHWKHCRRSAGLRSMRFSTSTAVSSLASTNVLKPHQGSARTRS